MICTILILWLQLHLVCCWLYIICYMLLLAVVYIPYFHFFIFVLYIRNQDPRIKNTFSLLMYIIYRYIFSTIMVLGCYCWGLCLCFLQGWGAGSFWLLGAGAAFFNALPLTIVKSRSRMFLAGAMAARKKKYREKIEAGAAWKDCQEPEPLKN